MSKSAVKTRSGMHSRRPNRDEKRRRSRRLFVAGGVLLALAILAAATFAYINSLAYRVCRVEAGVEVLASDFIKNGSPEAVFTADSERFDVHVPGKYQVKVKSGLFVHRCTLVVEDTVPPTAEARVCTVEVGKSCSAGELTGPVADATAVTATFVSPPDFSSPGARRVDIRLTDLGGNTCIVQSGLLVSPFRCLLEWEAGSAAPTAEDFALSGAAGTLEPAPAARELNHVGDYPVTLVSGGVSYPSTLRVVDTVAPRGELRDLTTCTHAPLEAERFVVSTGDATDVRASFQRRPDLTRAGTQQVAVLLTDEGGNETLLTATLTLEEDTEAPVILGTHDIEVLQGETVSYRQNVLVEDNFDEEIDFQIDSGGVDTGNPGTYQTVYTASDVSGNTSRTTVTVTVRPWSVDEAELDAQADEILAEIFTEDMSGLDKVNAIYDYVTGTIVYSNHSDKGDWAKAAYDGLNRHEGDCYVFACASKLLLTRAGITNMDITKSTASGTHYWNLVDLGDGWYHFDTTPNLAHPRIVMWTDAQLMYFSSNNFNTHDYDHSLYPGVK